MIGQCILYVYSAEDGIHIDMMLFFVEPNCPYSVEVSSRTIEPSTNLTVTLRGGRNGLAFVHATDKRVASFQKISRIRFLSPHSSLSFFWDLSLFTKSLSTKDHFRLINFIDARKVRAGFMESCRTAGAIILKQFNECGKYETSPSAVSNECLRVMIQACNRAKVASLEVMPVCDSRSKDCSLTRMAELSSTRKFKGNLLSAEHTEENEKRGSDEDEQQKMLRQYFPEVWLFDDYAFGESDRKSLLLKAPDSVTEWQLNAAFWIPNDRTVCIPKENLITSRKQFFLDIQLPQHVYVNETITAYATVTADELQSETSLSLCIERLNRKACAGVGVDGNRGGPSFTRIRLSPNEKIITRALSFRFFGAGSFEVTFVLREENWKHGKHHCDVGTLFDRVRINVDVSMRMEVERYFRRIVLDAQRPSSLFSSSDDGLIKFAYDDSKRVELVDFGQDRPWRKIHKLDVDITLNVSEIETVYSIAVELSRFAPSWLMNYAESQYQNIGRASRSRRVAANKKFFLMDVLGSLVSNFYLYKSYLLESKEHISVEEGELEKRIDSLISAILKFSDCSINSTCGFNQLERPKDVSDRSIILSAIAASLMCEANVNEEVLCPILRFIFDVVSNNAIVNDEEMYEHIFMEDRNDMELFVKALISHISVDCNTYGCVRNDEIWLKLREDFFAVSEKNVHDLRTLAAMAYMAPSTTRSILRNTLYSHVQNEKVPYWTTGHSDGMSRYSNVVQKYSSFFGRRFTKSGDVLLNSLGVLAFVGKDVTSVSVDVDFDPLIDWIYDQLHNDNNLLSVLDKYFANRALYEYRLQKLGFSDGTNAVAKILCRWCKEMNYALSGVPKLFYLPTSTREFSLAVRGSGKVYAGISVVLTKRHKLLRQPAGTSKHPVQITVKQSFDLPYILKQEVCLRFNDPLFTPVDITHGIYSGFSLKKRNIRLMPTALYYGVILNEPQISSFAAHIRLSQLQPNKDMCYEVLLDEPKIGYEPDSLAPVSIVVRHPFLDVIGETILTLRQRKGPSVLQEAVETVCWKSGCACSEISCSVRCSRCAVLTNDTLHRELCSHNAFAAVVIVEAIRSVGEDIEEYYVLEAQFELFKSPSSPWFIQPGLTKFWLRKCNRRCLRPLVGEKYFVLGSVEGFVLDADARYHYVLREDDRWEHAEEKCANIFFLLLLFKSC